LQPQPLPEKFVVEFHPLRFSGKTERVAAETGHQPQQTDPLRGEQYWKRYSEEAGAGTGCRYAANSALDRRMRRSSPP